MSLDAPKPTFDAATAAFIGESFRRTGALRYAVPDHATTDTLRLQEAWQGSNGTIEWRDIPTVVVPGLAPRR